ncbi:MAG: 16S rRNA (guanine(966)-N(2))-methyltransferase RsmD [Coriobacteriia bacterium]|nr:16S rRNA (guanine(966)-N(2))-methyltransferase RsmD [Coriobacteriia bacterium]
MRITGGDWNGRVFDAPEGMVTRPTSDLVRGAIFNTLKPMVEKWKDVVVLDGFAGSGALAFEALSRGAYQAYFVESDQRAFQVLQRNVSLFDVKNKVTLKRTDLLHLTFTKREDNPFNLVFLDPPYEYPAAKVKRLLSFLVESRVLARKALIVYEHSIDTKPELPDRFTLLKQNEYGSTMVSYIRFEGRI